MRPRRYCTVDGCGEPREGRGYCNRHYLAWKRYGDPLGGKTLRKRNTGSVTRYGYLQVGGTKGRTLRHVAIAERALGRPLPAGAQVHHVNGDRLDNRPGNLVICPNQAYHSLLHRRQQAMEACGNPEFRKCWICGSYSDPASMGPNSGAFHHHQCRRERDAQRSKK